MNAPATFFDKILTFAGDEIRPEYKLTGYKLSDDRRKIKFTDGFKAGEFDLWCNQKTLVYYSEQQIRRVRVIRRADGYCCQFLIDLERQEYHKPTGQITGIDLGLKEFYTDAQGNTVENPRYLGLAERSYNLYWKRLLARLRVAQVPLNLLKLLKTLASSLLSTNVPQSRATPNLTRKLRVSLAGEIIPRQSLGYHGQSNSLVRI